MKARVRVFASPEEAAAYCAATLRDVCRQRSPQHSFVAFSGGSTPKLVYQRLAEEHRHDLPWNRLHVFFVDERNVPPGHAESNHRLALEHLFSHVMLPANQIHPMPAHEPDLDLAARRYEESLRRAVPAVEGIPALDLVWLGMGSDGHTASLFPGASSLEEARRLVVASEAPGRGTRRLTFTYPLLNRAHRVQFLVTGGEKAATLARVLEGKEEARELPAARVQPEAGSLEWVVDLSAASAIGGAEILSEAP